MQKETVEYFCDFCGYGGWLSRAEDFTRIDGVDLCQWCARDSASPWAETGGHRVEFFDPRDSWLCSCGERFRQPTTVSRKTMLAVPSVVDATANLHLNGREIPA